MDKIIVLLGIFFLPLSLSAQKDKDFILTMQKDTLYGRINFDAKSNIITFRYQKDKVEFHAATIDNFGMHRQGITRVYKTITNDWKEEVFVEVLTEGQLNLYRYNTSGNKLYTELDNYRYYISESNTGLLRVSPKSFKHILRKVLKDHPSLLAQKINYKDFPKIIKAYNDLAMSQMQG